MKILLKQGLAYFGNTSCMWATYLRAFLVTLTLTTVVPAVSTSASNLHVGSLASSVESHAVLEYAGSAMWSLMSDVESDGYFAYCAMSDGLRVVDIRDRTAPTVVYQDYIADKAHALELKDSLLFMGTDHSGLILYNVAVPSYPEKLWQLDQLGEVRAVKCGDNELFVMGNDSLYAFDISTITTPLQIGSISIPPTSSKRDRGLVISNGYAFVASNDVFVVDLGRPDSMTIVSDIFGGYEYIAIDVEINANILYIANSSSYTPAMRSKITVCDISDVDSVVEIESYLFQGDLSDIELSGYLYYSAGSWGTYVLDVANPESPIQVGCIPAYGYSKTITVQQDVLLVSHRKRSADDSSPTGLCDPPPYAASKQAFLAPDSGDFIIFDVHEVGNPAVLGVLSHPGYVDVLTLSDGKAYVADELGRISILDVSNVDTLRLVASAKVPSSPHQLGKIANSILSANQIDGIDIIDVADDNNPSLLGSIPIPFWCGGVTCVNDLAYISAGATGLEVYDFSDSENPFRLGGTAVDDAALESSIVGNYALVCDRYSGLKVFDVGQPNNISLICKSPQLDSTMWVTDVAIGSELVAFGNAQEIKFSSVNDLGEINTLSSYHFFESDEIIDFVFGEGGQYLFVAMGRAGIRVLCVADPMNPILVDEYNTPGFAYAVAVESGFLYVADNTAILRLTYTTATDVKDDDGSRGVIPEKYNLLQNYPNPFNPSTRIQYEIARRSEIDLSIVNVLGRRVRTLKNGTVSPGSYMADWDGTDSNGNRVSSGVYFLRLVAGQSTQSKKMLLIK